MMPIFVKRQVLTSTIEPTTHILIVCVEEAWGGLGLDLENPLKPKLGCHAFVVIGGWQFCFRPKAC